MNREFPDQAKRLKQAILEDGELPGSVVREIGRGIYGSLNDVVIERREMRHEFAQATVDKFLHLQAIRDEARALRQRREPSVLKEADHGHTRSIQKRLKGRSR